MAFVFNFILNCWPKTNIIINDSLYMTDDDIYLSDSFNMTRKSKDNAFGVSLLLLCKIFSINILNGRNKHDEKGDFTCETQNGRSVVDNMIATCIDQVYLGGEVSSEKGIYGSVIFF